MVDSKMDNMVDMRNNAKRAPADAGSAGYVAHAHGAKRGHADEALALLRGLAAHVPGLVFQLRLSRSGRIGFPYASEAMREIFRLEPEEAREDGSKFLAMLHPGDVADFMHSLRVSARELSPWRHEFRIRLNNSRTRWLLGYGVPQSEAGGAVLWHGFIGYVTGQQRGKAGRMRGEFLSVAANELCRPVSVIGGFADVLLKQNPDEPSQREFLAIISRKMALLSSIIVDLNELALIEKHQGEGFVFAATDLVNLLREVAGAFVVPEGCAALDLKLPAKPLFIDADRNQVVRAMLRALAHTHQSLPQGGNVRISVSARAAGREAGNGGRMIAVRIVNQLGAGNSMECKPVRERVVPGRVPAQALGTGLSMSIAMEIVDLHGGEVCVSSRAGRDNGMSMLFPASATRRRTVSKPKPGKPGQPNRNLNKEERL